jgi:hemoglobin-like flavoprotein
LFPDDMERQKVKLMDALAAAVGALDNRAIFRSVIAITSRQHAQIGAQASHFVAFGEALMDGLDQHFGPTFTPALKQAWLALYDEVQSEMTRAAEA